MIWPLLASLTSSFSLTLPLLTLLLLTALLSFPQNARYIATSVLWDTMFSVFAAHTINPSPSFLAHSY